MFKKNFFLSLFHFMSIVWLAAVFVSSTSGDSTVRVKQQQNMTIILIRINSRVFFCLFFSGSMFYCLIWSIVMCVIRKTGGRSERDNNESLMPFTREKKIYTSTGQKLESTRAAAVWWFFLFFFSSYLCCLLPPTIWCQQK